MAVRANNFFTKEEKDKIKNAIEQAELNTGGEIRLHVDTVCKKDVLDRAANVFAMLNMHKTELRNGVLFYMSVRDRKFAIIGDVGINEKVPSDFWDATKNMMISEFEKQQVANGLIKGILEAGNQLKEHFPLLENDENELSDEISFGK